MTGLWIFCTVLFPRLTLLLTYMFGTMPANDVPFWGDVAAAIFFPNWLVAYYGYYNHVHIIWIVIMVLVGLMRFGGEGSTAKNSGGS